MNDKKIFKISLVTTIIEKIDKSKIDNQVEVDATIMSITQTKSNTKIIKLKDETGTINLVIFSSIDVVYDLRNNQKVRVIARVTQYNNDLELILEEPKIMV